MRLNLFVRCLVVSLLVCVAVAKRVNSGHAAGPQKIGKNDSSDAQVTKLKLPGRTVVVPAKKEQFAISAVKTLRKLGKGLLKSVKKASKTVSSLNRDIKAYFSSDFEVLLLRMTAPTDEKTSPGDITRFMATTNTFIYNDDITSDSSTYRITLRKLWAKIGEKDSRTVVKALHILHTLLATSKSKNASIYWRLIHRMSRQFDRRTRAKYFDVKALGRMDSGVTEEDQLLAKYAKNLFEFVALRGKTFTFQFEELKAIGYKQKARDIVAKLESAITLIDAALQCSSGLDAGSEAVAASLCLVGLDLRELFDLFGKKARWLLHEHEVGDLFENWAEEERSGVLSRIKEAYESRYDKVAALLTEITDMAELYNEKIPLLKLNHDKSLLEQFSTK